MNLAQISQQFEKFTQNFMQKNPGIDPRRKVQELLNSGKMSQQQFDQLQNMARNIMNNK